jgi:hypothetical protein
MILENSIYLLTCERAYAIEGLHSGLMVIDLEETIWPGADLSDAAVLWHLIIKLDRR